MYAHSGTPIKLWTTEMLNKLEADVLRNDDGGDTCVAEETEAEGKCKVVEMEMLINV